MTIRSLFEHVGIDTTGKTIYVNGMAVDPAPGTPPTGPAGVSSANTERCACGSGAPVVTLCNEQPMCGRCLRSMQAGDVLGKAYAAALAIHNRRTEALKRAHVALAEQAGKDQAAIARVQEYAEHSDDTAIQTRQTVLRLLAAPAGRQPAAVEPQAPCTATLATEWQDAPVLIRCDADHGTPRWELADYHKGPIPGTGLHCAWHDTLPGPTLHHDPTEAGR